MNCLPRTDFIQNYITANNLDRCREISSDWCENELVSVRAYVRVYFRRKCIGKPYIKDRLACCFVNYKDENCARYGQFIDFPAMCIFCTPNVLYNCIYRIGG